MTLTDDDLRRARTYITRPDLPTVPSLVEWMGALLDEIDQFRVGREQVLALHRDAGIGMGHTPTGYGDFPHACGTCGTHDEYAVEWPCPTALALGVVAAPEPAPTVPPPPAEDPCLCPDCGGDPFHPDLHRDGCARVGTCGQFGPPWLDRPWHDDPGHNRGGWTGDVWLHPHLRDAHQEEAHRG